MRLLTVDSLLRLRMLGLEDLGEFDLEAAEAILNRTGIGGITQSLYIGKLQAAVQGLELPDTLLDGVGDEDDSDFELVSDSDSEECLTRKCPIP